jgi:hypothetical protein
MKKTERELDEMHNICIKTFYEVFQEEMDSFFRFKEAALEVLSHGNAFPFRTHYDDATDHICKSLDVIEKNMIEHIIEQIELYLKEEGKTPTVCSEHSELLKREFAKKIRDRIMKRDFRSEIKLSIKEDTV